MMLRARHVAPAAAAAALALGTATARAQMDTAMDMDTMQGGAAPGDARDPHAYSDSVDFTRGDARPTLADQQRFRSLLIDHLETSRSDGHSLVPYDIEGWHGTTWDRAVLKAEGEFAGGHLADARTELLWSHAIAPYWDTQVGVRHDSGPGPGRTWLAAGIEGLAPYWFDLEVTAYAGQSNRTALRLDASYDMLLTQRLILEPRFEANWYGRSDPERRLGSGLSDVALALRLRYEIRRELAPYIGVERSRLFGGTKNVARTAGEDASETRYMIGLTLWF